MNILVRRDQFNITPQGIVHKPTDAAFTPSPGDPYSGITRMGQLDNKHPNGSGFRSDDVQRMMRELWIEYVIGNPKLFKTAESGADPGMQERNLSPLVAIRTSAKETAMVTEARETGTLIGSDKVEGTAVYGAGDQEIGSIERVMIDKISGKVAYAVLSFGGFLGIGDDHYPLPWQSLKYDTNLGGYRTGITENQLRGAPKFSNDNAWNWNDPARTRAVNDYYGVAI